MAERAHIGDSLSGLSNDDFLSGIFKASDFPTPAPGVPGTLGRKTYRGPRYFNVDISFIKSVKIPWAGTNSADVQFRIESFNLFNTTNLDLPIGNLSDPLFGQSVSAAARAHRPVLGQAQLLRRARRTRPLQAALTGAAPSSYNGLTCDAMVLRP